MVKLADVLGLFLCGFLLVWEVAIFQKKGQSKENLEKCGVLWKGVIFEFKSKISKSKFPKVQVADKAAAIFLIINIKLFSSLKKYLEFYFPRVILEKLTLSFLICLYWIRTLNYFFNDWKGDKKDYVAPISFS